MGLIKRDQVEQKGTIIVDKEIIPLPTKRPPLEPLLPKLEQPRQPVAPLIPAPDLGKAKAEADKIINEARAKADSIREDAVDEGRAEGRAESAAKIREALQTVNEAVVEKKKILKDAEPEILRLAIKIAEQIIRSEVSLHRDVCLNIVAEAIARVSDREQILVRVNREDAEFLKRYKDRLAAILDGVKSFSILEDQNIEPGGCVIETNLGFIDSKISTKLKSIEEALAKESDTIQQESSSKVPPLPPKKEIANEPADLKADLANDLDDGFDDELEDELDDDLEDDLDDDLEDDLDDDLDDRLDDNPKDELKEKKPLADDDFGDDLQLDDFDKDF